MQEKPHENRKAAILVRSLDAETAEQLLAQLAPAERRQVREQAQSLGPLDPAEQQQVVEAFFLAAPRSDANSAEGVELAGNLREFSLDGPHPGLAGPHPASGVYAPWTMGSTDESAVEGLDQAADRPFGFLLQAQGENLLPLLADEHPQTIALVMAHLPPRRAAEILEGLAPQVQVEVVRRLIDLDEASPEIIREVERGLEQRLAQVVRSRQRNSAGLAAVTQILEVADHRVEKLILRNIAHHDQQLASRLTRRLLECADLEELDDATLAAVLEVADPELGILALAGASADLVERLLARMPGREAKLLRHALANLGPTRLAEVESARQELLRLARQLAAN